MTASPIPGTSAQDLLQPVEKHRDLIFDVGLHIGEDTAFYLRKGFRVIAFEANPELCRRCRQQFAKEIDSGQLILIEGAIQANAASGDGKVRFYINENNSVWGTVLPDWSDRNSRLGTTSTVLEVPAVDFSQVIRKYGIPHYMKIDIEGCDMVCIDTLKEFQLRPDFVSIESDKTAFAKIKDEIDALVALGYDSFKAVEQSTIPEVQSPPNPPREGEYAAHTFLEGSSGLFGRELAGSWLSRSQVLDSYRWIRLGYYLLGDDGVMSRWRFRGAWQLKRYAADLLQRRTKGPVPGWHDTHARHSSFSEH
jgi:FkbM family methyltransferase